MISYEVSIGFILISVVRHREEQRVEAVAVEETVIALLAFHDRGEDPRQRADDQL